MMMSNQLGLTVVAASLLFGSAPGVASGTSTTSAVHSLATSSHNHDNDPAKFASLFRQAPVGQRQPHQSDVPETTQLSPDDLEAAAGEEIASQADHLTVEPRARKAQPSSTDEAGSVRIL
jgi:hypothetical protein